MLEYVKRKVTSDEAMSNLLNADMNESSRLATGRAMDSFVSLSMTSGPASAGSSNTSDSSSLAGDGNWNVMFGLLAPGVTKLNEVKPLMRKSRPVSDFAVLDGWGVFGSTKEASAALSYSLSSEPATSEE